MPSRFSAPTTRYGCSSSLTLDLRDYELLVEKLDLLLRLRASTHVTWSGRHRPPLTGQGVFPRPVQDPLPIWVGVGGTQVGLHMPGHVGEDVSIQMTNPRMSHPDLLRGIELLGTEVAPRAGRLATA